jgi:transglutaminase-like putative cysteine protease
LHFRYFRPWYRQKGKIGHVRIAASLVVAAMLAGSSALAQKNDQVRRTPAPDWVVPSEPMAVPPEAGGLVFVRRHDTLVHLDREGEAHHLGYRIKILHANALQLGNLSLAWNPAAGAPAVHAIRVHRAGKAFDVLESASFEVLRREDQLEAATLTGVLTAVLRVPDLRVGDELEVALTVRSSDPTLGGNSSGLLVLPPEPAPGRFRLGLSWEEGQEPHLRMTPPMAAPAQRRTRAVAFAFDNPPALAPPKDAPPRYNWQRVVEYSDFKDWAEISRHFAPLYAKAATLGSASPLKAEARRIGAAHSNPLDRAKAALKLVQQEVRYIYVGLDGGNLTPATAEETWRRRYGDCKGKTALLLALLAELGVEAAPVLASNSGADDGLDSRLPSPGMFDHVLVRARIDGSDYWLDGTLPPVAGPSEDPAIPYRWTLPLTARGSSIQPLKWRLPETPDEISLYEIDARAGFAEPARITSTKILRGIAGLQQQVQFSGLTPAQMLAGLREQLIGDMWQSVDDAKWRYDERAQASILTISGTGTVDWDDDGGGERSLALPGGGFNPPEKRVRPAGQDQDAPYYTDPEFSCHVTTVRLPQSTRPSHWSFNSSFDARMFGRNFYRAFELRDGAIRMVRGSRVEQPEIDSATAKRDNARIAAFDNSMAWITYKPSRRGPEPKSGMTVSATYEMDWTAAKVPCLASAPPK